MPAITSLLDTDMYKITMHAAVVCNFPDVEVIYKYTNRSADSMKFNSAAIEWLESEFKSLQGMAFSDDDIQYLREEIPYLPQKYFDYISSGSCYLDPAKHVQFSHTLDPETSQYDISIYMEGLWKDTILYEIPLLALVSEAYFKFVDTDWSYDGQMELAYQKAKTLLSHGLKFSEFGTRRRRSFKTQDLVMQGIAKANAERNDNILLGTSNVLFARKYGLKPIGTVAHEWIMGIASITKDYTNANKRAMDYWLQTFGTANAGLALTDTFGTDAFLQAFKPPYSDYYTGVRQDSGDPIEYTKKIANHYNNVLNCPKFSKIVCYSDSLNVKKAIRYAAVAHEYGLLATFGIGTNFTNDFYRKSQPSIKSEPLNIVIKLLQVNGNPAIKISDNLGKNMGDADTVQRVKEELGYVERSWTGDNEAHRWT